MAAPPPHRAIALSISTRACASSRMSCTSTAHQNRMSEQSTSIDARYAASYAKTASRASRTEAISTCSGPRAAARVPSSTALVDATELACSLRRWYWE
eukprot:scaffold234665_cov31-Tisochrysis_lutea.AAC.1